MSRDANTEYRLTYVFGCWLVLYLPIEKRNCLVFQGGSTIQYTSEIKGEHGLKYFDHPSKYGPAGRYKMFLSLIRQDRSMRRFKRVRVCVRVICKETVRVVRQRCPKSQRFWTDFPRRRPFYCAPFSVQDTESTTKDAVLMTRPHAAPLADDCGKSLRKDHQRKIEQCFTIADRL